MERDWSRRHSIHRRGRSSLMMRWDASRRTFARPGMGVAGPRLLTAVKKVFIFAVLLAMIAMPMAFAGTGFCRAMPCCAPHAGTEGGSLEMPDCCDTTSCDEAPAFACEYTSSKQLTPQTVSGLVAFAILPAALTTPIPSFSIDSSPVHPPALQRRMALLSNLLI